jgi:hypothetical protein
MNLLLACWDGIGLEVDPQGWLDDEDEDEYTDEEGSEEYKVGCRVLTGGSGYDDHSNPRCLNRAKGVGSTAPPVLALVPYRAAQLAALQPSAAVRNLSDLLPVLTLLWRVKNRLPLLR